jgi:hypothetical protein
LREDRTVVLRCSLLVAILAACAPRPGTNLAMVQMPGHSWHGPIRNAAYAKTGEVTVGLGSHVMLTVADCADHVKAKLGALDLDERVARDDRGAEILATDGSIDIEQCSPNHLRAKLWARFPDGGRVDASIDTQLAAQ